MTTSNLRGKVEEIIEEFKRRVRHGLYSGDDGQEKATSAILDAVRNFIELEHECKCMPGQGAVWNRCEGCVMNSCLEEMLRRLK